MDRRRRECEMVLTPLVALPDWANGMFEPLGQETVDDLAFKGRAIGLTTEGSDDDFQVSAHIRALIVHDVIELRTYGQQLFFQQETGLWDASSVDSEEEFFEQAMWDLTILMIAAYPDVFTEPCWLDIR